MGFARGQGTMFDPAMFSLAGRRAVVTGGGRGLGRAVAEALGRMGAEVCLAGRNHAALDEAVTALGNAGVAARALVLDVRDTAGAPAALAALDAEWPIDILVNNAGIENVRASLDVDAALWDSILDTNLKGGFFCAQAVARCMSARGAGGAIVNLCSLTSYVGVPTAVAYGSSKAGLLGMTRALASEWACLGIRVNAIAPGYFRTEMTEIFYDEEAWVARMLDRIPQRRFGRVEDVGGAVAFLCSDAAAYVTGQCIAIDGGYLASI